MFRGYKLILAGMTLTALSAVAALAAPVPGTYRSTDLGGALFTGHASQSWNLPSNAAHGVGDVYNSESWDGALLGTQWSFTCGQQGAPQLVQDNRVAGTGTVVYTNSFLGGTFSFTNGPWCNTASCSGVSNQTLEIVTVQYVSNVPVASVVNISTSGVFTDTQCNLTFVISNGVGEGDTDGGPKPATYPAFLDPTCAPTRVYGSWGDVITITARIDCPTPAKQSTWGAIKSQYR